MSAAERRKPGRPKLELVTMAEDLRESLLAMLSSTRAVTFPTARYREDPVAFFREILGVEPWSKQIEMIEAVGREYWPSYFQSVARLLKPGGRACIQSIVIDDALWERYIRSTDFIQQYVFPGGCLPCPREFRRHAEAAGLRVVDEMAFGPDYAETLRRWRETFLQLARLSDGQIRFFGLAAILFGILLLVFST